MSISLALASKHKEFLRIILKNIRFLYIPMRIIDFNALASNTKDVYSISLKTFRCSISVSTDIDFSKKYVPKWNDIPAQSLHFVVPDGIVL